MTETLPSTTSPARDSASLPPLPLRPIVAPLIRHRASAAAIGIASAAQVVLTTLHLPGLDCPFLRLSGVPCPGCGLSRACATLVTGSPEHSLRMHAFALPVLIAVAVLLVSAALPERARQRLADAVECAERATGVAFLLLVSIMIYWLARLLYAPQAFVSLVGHP